ncbi:MULTISPECIES: substrate-binding protein [unclassified Haloferax]|uniref:substrate-binding protein n=1 Tax=Haloferax TaxID=2251 RepID=UPI0002B0C643|nr:MULTISPECIES: substrate-binding protein [unclassified Haloferax]ELZ61077.1 branched-chain amino acid ABC transporter substrate-binding protein [Haloferax sp. ATCC BAA-645]ELZ61671.1 branched-chain amino acid ABC transporter substrate-binding protein [Haloferax sp. ATCC BAA-646]ELZ71427.1 branched-chain amino acid ABC transporter substrate-binding protein [Haloferax sp. ATCC BAA-644]
MTDQPALTDESRRRYLKAIGTAGLTAGLAGCSGGGGGNGGGGDGGGDSDGENNAGGGGGDDSSGGEDYEAIGNFPPEGNSVSIGFNGPTSGALGPDGQDQEKGFDLAVKHLNEGGGLVDYWDRLSGDGIMGYQVEPTKADTAGSADTAQDNIERMIQRDNIQFWTGGMSSTVTMAMQNVAQREKVPFMGGNSTSAGISGENCSRYYFHPTFHAEIIGMAMGEAAPSVLGEDRSLFHIYMDYSYGQSNRDAARKYLTEQGPWEDVGGAAIAEGETDHSSQIQALEDSGADTLYFSSFGNFAASGLAQLRDAGLTDDIDVIIPHVSAFTLDPLGADAEGVLGMEPWNPNADNEASQAFVESYQAEYDETPNQSSLHTYESMMVYAAAVEEAGTFHPPTVVRTLEDFEWSLAWGDSAFRTCDHQVERPWYMVQGVGDDRAEELGIRTEIVETTDPLVYECSEFPASNCAMDDNEYGDE